MTASNDNASPGKGGTEEEIAAETAASGSVSSSSEVQGASSPQTGADTTDPSEESVGLELKTPAPTSEELEALQRERDDLRDQLLRRRADFENYRKRVAREKNTAELEGASSVLAALVPSLDNLDRALRAGGDEAALREGVEMTRRTLLSALQGLGLVVVEAAGERFDPRIHQALTYENAPDHEDGTVIEVFGNGYVFKERLIRPAMVKVAKGESAEQSAGDNAGPSPEAAETAPGKTADANENGSGTLH